MKPNTTISFFEITNPVSKRYYTIEVTQDTSVKSTSFDDFSIAKNHFDKISAILSKNNNPYVNKTLLDSVSYINIR